VLNRGNGRQKIFHGAGDYDAFERVLAEAMGRYPVGLFGYCLMPNHWHLIVRPRGDRDLPAFMRWLMVTHVRRHHEAHETRGGGHLYQGRYKSFPIQSDQHFLTVARYVEANALRAGLVACAAEWRWSSLYRGAERRTQLNLDRWPVPRPADWDGIVQARMEEKELEKLRLSAQRGRPFGSVVWIKRTAERMGLGQTLNPPGRPKMGRDNQ
jgi:putative transposase